PTRNMTDPLSSSTYSDSLPNPDRFATNSYSNSNSGFGSDDLEQQQQQQQSRDPLNGRSAVNLFETSLPMRLDYEAVAAYVLLPPAGAVLLLLVEHKSDYVRYVL
ncbi:MAG: hypothetical protein LQ340_004273, partial [Diploschistes diacapsis]